MNRPSMRYRNGEGPTLIFKGLLGPPVSVEMDFHPDDSELWALFTLLQNAPDIVDLLKRALPELQTYNLVAPSPLLSHLFKRIEGLSEEARLRRQYFMQSTTAYRNLTEYRPSQRKVVRPGMHQFPDTFKPISLDFK